MTRAEEIATIERMASGDLRDELDYQMTGIDRDPADHPDGYDLVDALEEVSSRADSWEDACLKAQCKRVERALGWWRRVRPNEIVVEASRTRGSRTLRPGDWTWCRDGF